MKQDNYDIPIIDAPAIPQALLDAYESGNLVVFVGAGVSRLMGCEGWDSMANDLICEVCSPSAANQICNSNLSSREKITIAKRIAQKEHKQRQFWKIFHKAITPRKNATDVYEIISRLETTFITTNCDGLLVKHFSNSSTTDCTIDKFEQNESKTYVFCIHGNYGKGNKEEKASLVFCVEDYLRAYKQDSQLVRFLRLVMDRKTVLFLGYGLREFEILNAAFNESEKTKHYVLEGFFSYQQEYCNALGQYYRSVGINLIAYNKDKNDYKQQIAIISNWVNELVNKTSYSYKVISRLNRALDQFNEAEKEKVKNELLRNDDMQNPFTVVLFDKLPYVANSGKWIAFLITDILQDETLFNDLTERNAEKRCRLFFYTITRCMSNQTFEDYDKGIVQAFVRRVVENHISIIRDSQYYNLAYRIMEAFVICGLQPQTENEQAQFTVLGSSFDSGFHFIKENRKYIKEWTPENQKFILTQPLRASLAKNVTHGLYFFVEYSNILVRDFSEEVRIHVLHNCFTFLFSTVEDSYYSCFAERYRSSAGDDVKYVFDAISILLKTLQYIEKQQIITELFEIMNGSFQHQIAFHYAMESEIFLLDNIRQNPLDTRSTFVDFYLWLNAYIQHNKMTDEASEQIFKWIQIAEFGYEIDETEQLWAERKRKRINTYKVQLLTLLVKYSFKYNEYLQEIVGLGIYDQKPPVEDINSYYIMSDMHTIPPLKIQQKDLSGLGATELLQQVEKAKQNSEWNVDFYDYESLYRDLFMRIEPDKLMDVINLLIGEDYPKLIPAISALSNNDCVRILPQEDIQSFLQQLIKRLNMDNKGEQQEQCIHHVVYFLEFLHREHIIQDGAILCTLLDIDRQEVFSVHKSINNDTEIIGQLINNAESELYILSFECAYSSRTDVLLCERYINWLSIEDTVQASPWLILSAAFAYCYVHDIGDIIIQKVHSLFDTYSDTGLLGVCLCSNSKYIYREVVDFLLCNDRMKTLSDAITPSSSNHDNAQSIIRYIVAAHYFDYISEEIYTRFISDLSDDRETANFLAGAIVSCVGNPETTKQNQMIKKTYRTYCQSHKNSQFYELFISNMSQIHSIDDVELWDLLFDSVTYAYNSNWVWHSLSDCIKHSSDKVYSRIHDTINHLCELCEKDPEVELWEYEINTILYQLAVKQMLDTVKKVSIFAVKKSIEPITKYSEYIGYPQKALELKEQT